MTDYHAGYNGFLNGDIVSVQGTLISHDGTNAVVAMQIDKCAIVQRNLVDGKFVVIAEDDACSKDKYIPSSHFPLQTAFLVRSRLYPDQLYVENARGITSSIYCRRLRFANETEIAVFREQRAIHEQAEKERAEKERLRKEKEAEEQQCEKLKQTVDKLSLEKAL